MSSQETTSIVARSTFIIPADQVAGTSACDRTVVSGEAISVLSSYADHVVALGIATRARAGEARAVTNGRKKDGPAASAGGEA